MEHPFRVVSAHYIYILNHLSKEEIVVEGVGYTKVEALENIKEIKCHFFYKDPFNFLLTKNRELEIWDTSNKVKQVTHLMKSGDDREPHKHPVVFSKEISKGSTFDWFYKTTYFLKNPTSEEIKKIQKEKWWDSKTKPLFIFYWDIKDKIGEACLDFYFPKWLTKHEYSKTYEKLDFDTDPIDESKTTNLGIKIERNKKPVNNIRKHLPKEFRKYFNYANESKQYFCTSVKFSSDRIQKTPITVTTGILMPSSKYWKADI